jgi:integrase
MPIKAKELPDVSIRRLRHTVSASGKPTKAKHPVGGVSGLYLQCNPPVGSEKIGARQWILRVRIGTQRREFGLGGYPVIPTQKAREAAKALKEEIKSGIDPKLARASAKAQILEEQRKELTFKAAAAKYVTKRSAEYKTAKQSQRLRNQLDNYVIPYIGNMQVKDIERHHLISMMQKYYEAVPDTAIRVINHVAKIIQQAIIEGQRTTHNPAIWANNLSIVFPSKEKIAPTQHHPDLPWQQLPEFMIALDDYNKPKGLRPDVDCLAFIIHTVARVSEARLMKWSDVDLANKVWTIKPSGVKGDDKRKSKWMWKIPLTTPAIKILRSQPSYASQRGLVFKTLDKKEIDGSYFGSNINSELGFEGDTHGFRTTFKTWCQEHGVNDEVSELSLKHTSSDATRAAYARSQLFDDRKRLMAAYSKYAMTGQSLPTNNVIPIRKRAS